MHQELNLLLPLPDPPPLPLLQIQAHMKMSSLTDEQQAVVHDLYDSTLKQLGNFYLKIAGWQLMTQTAL